MSYCVKLKGTFYANVKFVKYVNVSRPLVKLKYFQM